MDNQMEVVLCGASSYNRKYFFNPEFGKLPDEVKRELQVLCVMFTEGQSGVFTMGFDGGGKLLFGVDHEPGDMKFDADACEDEIQRIRAEEGELLSQLTLYYNCFMLGRLPEDLKL